VRPPTEFAVLVGEDSEARQPSLPHRSHPRRQAQPRPDRRLHRQHCHRPPTPRSPTPAAMPRPRDRVPGVAGCCVELRLISLVVGPPDRGTRHASPIDFLRAMPDRQALAGDHHGAWPSFPRRARARSCVSEYGSSHGRGPPGPQHRGPRYDLCRGHSCRPESAPPDFVLGLLHASPRWPLG